MIFSILGSRLAGYVGIGVAVLLGLALIRAEFQIGWRDGEIMMYREAVEGPTGYIARGAILTANNATLERDRAALRAALDQIKIDVRAISDRGVADTARANRVLAELRGNTATTGMLADMIASRMLPAGQDVCAATLFSQRRPNQ